MSTEPNDFELDLDLKMSGDEGAVTPSAEEVVVSAPSAPTKKGQAKKKTEPPADERVRIIIDEVPGMSNYEFVGVNGRAYQIKRGVPVLVPIEVVYALEDAVLTQVEIRRNQITGEREEVVQNRSAIPWRRA